VPNPSFETVEYPFTAFRFAVVIDLAAPPPGLTNPICNAAFAECDGLEMTIEPKSVREGGSNRQQIHLVGPVSYSQLTLRRGMTPNMDLWTWFVAAATPGRLSTALAHVALWDADGTPKVTFELRDCFPIKLRGPALNAKEGQVAIEEMQLAYRQLDIRPATGSGLLGGVGIGLAAGASVSAGIGFGASASISGGLSVSGGAGLSGKLGAGLQLG
jgi:phage tail-like protein